MARNFLSLLLATLTLAIAADANPVVQVRDNLVRLPIAKRFNFTGSSTILAKDQARVANLRARAHAKLTGTPLDTRAVISAPADNQVVDYVVNVSVMCTKGEDQKLEF